MADIEVRKIDDVWLHVSAPSDKGIEMELREKFTFQVPNSKYHPKVKAGIWDGRVRLYNPINKRIHLGLLRSLNTLATNLNYTINCVGQIFPSLFDKKEVVKWLENIDVYSKGEEVEIRDYQFDLVVKALTESRMLTLSPTSSGKSLTAALIARWCVDHDIKVLIITPNVMLVKQMSSDLVDYQLFEQSEVQQMFSGQSKVVEQNLLVSTWQTLHSGTKEKKGSQDFPAEWFNQFGCIICDEAHLASAASLQGIFEKTTHVPIKIGMTGSLQGAKCHELVLEGLFGPIHKAITTRELIDRGQIADVDIKCIVLKHPENACKVLHKKDWQTEIDWIVSNPHRNKFISKLALSRPGNTLILLNYVEKHGQIVYDQIQEMNDQERQVFFLHGKVDADFREEVRHLTEQENGVIIVASYGVLSTGVSIRSLHNVIFASPTKSRVRTLQSLGRGLRLGDNKDKCTLFDIGDDLSFKKTSNHTLRHMLDRISYYAEDQLNYRITNVPIQGDQ